MGKQRGATDGEPPLLVGGDLDGIEIVVFDVRDEGSVRREFGIEDHAGTGPQFFDSAALPVVKEEFA